MLRHRTVDIGIVCNNRVCEGHGCRVPDSADAANCGCRNYVAVDRAVLQIDDSTRLVVVDGATVTHCYVTAHRYVGEVYRTAAVVDAGVIVATDRTVCHGKSAASSMSNTTPTRRRIVSYGDVGHRNDCTPGPYIHGASFKRACIASHDYICQGQVSARASGLDPASILSYTGIAVFDRQVRDGDARCPDDVEYPVNSTTIDDCCAWSRSRADDGQRIRRETGDVKIAGCRRVFI